MDQHFKANAVLLVFCKNDRELKKGLPIRSSEMGVLNIIAHMPVMLEANTLFSAINRPVRRILA